MPCWRAARAGRVSLHSSSTPRCRCRAPTAGGERGDGASPRFKYGWLGPADTDETDAFQACTRIDALRVYRNTVDDGQKLPNCPCDFDGKIGEAGKTRSLIAVHKTWDGWHRVDLDGELGWVSGWFVAGAQ